MKTGIICAMETELKDLLKEATIKEEKIIAGRTFYHVKKQKNEVVLVVSGIGKVNAAITAVILINNFKVKEVVSLGIAGGTDLVGLGDLVIGTKLCYHDFNLEHFNHKFGSIPGRDLYFNSEKKLLEKAKAKADSLGIRTHLGLIVSGDAFISNNKQIEKAINNFVPIYAVEMESSAIAHVCDDFNVPFLALRFISDIIGKENQKKDYKKFEKECGLAIKEIAEAFF